MGSEGTGFEGNFVIPALVLVTVGVVLTLRHFAAPDVSLAVRVQLALSWTLSLSILALVPADIAATASGDEKSRPTLATLWDLSYWITFNLTWFVLPLHQIYEDAGDFTVTGRLLTSLKENLIFYAVLLGVALLGVVGLTANGAMTLTGVTSFSIASATSFGIVAGIFLLGYGVVEVPRTIWRSANIQKRPIQAYRKVGEVAAALRIAHRQVRISHSPHSASLFAHTRTRRDYKTDPFFYWYQLLKITTASETTNEVMPRNHDLRWMMRVIKAETPKSTDIRGGSSTPNQETNQETHEDDDHGGEYDYDYDETSDMVSLRRALKRKTYVLAFPKSHHCLLPLFEYSRKVTTLFAHTSYEHYERLTLFFPNHSRVYRRTAAQYVVAVRAALEAEAVLNASGLGAGGLGDRGCLISRCVMRFPNPIPPPCLHIQD